MKRITIEVPDEMHTKLKAKTALERVTIKALLSQFLNNYLNNFKISSNGKKED